MEVFFKTKSIALFLNSTKKGGLFIPRFGCMIYCCSGLVIRLDESHNNKSTGEMLVVLSKHPLPHI
ncbi:hypothetical protein SLEP1_g6317 [Rubroshorea leprosula]|uniref:Uncharacterized protein n=1 Tax=Rubroshorea leprosula TaxID=152421 RepID=A0AAV5I4M2_9ROSI|nr:hypothetical protein SLEP1_g6317 [Rubroshorea leprosula]